MIQLILFIACLAPLQADSNWVEINDKAGWNTYETTKLPSDVLFFSKSHCPWCEKQEPILKEIASEFKDRRFIHINVPEAARQYKIRLFPTLIIDGEKIVGYQEKPAIKSKLEKKEGMTFITVPTRNRIHNRPWLHTFFRN